MPNIRISLEVINSDNVVIADQKTFSLLVGIRELGSVAAAARAVGLSYKRSWDIINTLNQSLTTPATSGDAGGYDGGGTRLTNTGLDLVNTYYKIDVDAATMWQTHVYDITKHFK